MVKIFTFGRLEIFDNNKPIHLSTQKQAALILYLILNQRIFPRVFLANTFWGKMNTVESLKNLNRNLYFIKRDFPSSKNMLSIDSKSIGAKPAKIWIDAIELDEIFKKIKLSSGNEKEKLLNKALNLYKGEFLEGIFIKEADEFNDWMFLKKEHYKQNYINAINHFADYFIEEKKHTEAIRLLNLSLQEDALQEIIHQKLIQQYILAKQKKMAIEQFQRCQKTIKKELNVDPLPETIALINKIKTIPDIHPGKIKTSFPEEKNDIPLIGRKRILQKINNWLKDKSFKFGIILGEACSSKTRVLGEAIKKIKEKYIILYAEGSEFKKLISYSPFIDILRQLVFIPELKFIKNENWFKFLTLLMPEFKDKDAENAIVGLEYPTFKNQILEGLYGLFSCLCSNFPVIIILDNFHFIDFSSLEALYNLMERLKGLNFYVLALAREEPLKDMAHINKFLTEMREKGLTKKIKIPLFELFELEEFLSRNLLLKDRTVEVAELIFKKTGGNPLFTVEVIKNLLYECKKEHSVRENLKTIYFYKSKINITQDIKSAIEEKFLTLTDNQKKILKVASIIGEDFSCQLIKNIELDKGELGINLAGLVEKNFLIEKSARGTIIYSFCNELIRDYINDQINMSENIYWHEKIASVMEKYYKNSPEHLPEIAHHYLKAGNQSKALKHCTAHAESSFKVHAYSEALTSYEILESLLKDKIKLGRAYSKMGYIHFSLGNFKRAKEYYEKSIRLLKRPSDIADLYYRIARLYYFQGNLTEFKSIMAKNKKFKSLDTKTRKNFMFVDYAYAYVLFNEGRLNAAKQLALKNLKLINQKNNPELAVKYISLLGRIYFEELKFDKAVSLCEKALYLSGKNNLPVHAGRSTAFLGGIEYERGDYKKTLEYYHKAASIFGRSPIKYGLAAIYNAIAKVYIVNSDFNEAFRYLKNARENCAPEDKYNLIWNYIYTAESYIQSNRINDSQKIYGEFIDLVKSTNFKYETLYIKYLKAKILSKTSSSKKDFKIASKLYKEVISFLRKHNKPLKIAEVSFEFAKIKKEKGEKNFCKCLNEPLNTYKKIKNAKKIKEIKALLDKN